MSLYTVLSGKIVVEFAADEPTTIFEDDAGTDTAEDGEGVANWASTANGSLSTAGLQTTSGQRPLYDADVGDGFPALDFDGSDDVLSVADHASLDVASAMHLFVVAMADSLAADQGVVTKFGNGSWNDGWGIITFGGGFSFSAQGMYTAGTSDRNSSTATRYLLSCRGVTAAGTAGPLLIGSASGGFDFNGKIHHVILCSALTLEQENNALHYLWTRWTPAEIRLLDHRSLRAQPALISGGSGGGASPIGLGSSVIRAA